MVTKSNPSGQAEYQVISTSIYDLTTQQALPTPLEEVVHTTKSVTEMNATSYKKTKEFLAANPGTTFKGKPSVGYTIFLPIDPNPSDPASKPIPTHIHSFHCRMIDPVLGVLNNEPASIPSEFLYPSLTDEQKTALEEYLKAHPSTAAQRTPKTRVPKTIDPNAPPNSKAARAQRANQLLQNTRPPALPPLPSLPTSIALPTEIPTNPPTSASSEAAEQIQKLPKNSRAQREAIQAAQTAQLTAHAPAVEPTTENQPAA